MTIYGEAQMRCAPHDPDNLLDRVSRESTLQAHYCHLVGREQRLLSAHLGITAGRVLSVGSGWHPGRHLFPAPEDDQAAMRQLQARLIG